MLIYIVVFDGAYGLQVEEVFSSKEKAKEFIKEDSKKCKVSECQYEILEKIVY